MKFESICTQLQLLVLEIDHNKLKYNFTFQYYQVTDTIYLYNRAAGARFSDNILFCLTY